MLLELHPRAVDELEARVRLLERERKGHGHLFYAEVPRRVAQAARFPGSGVPVPGFEARPDVRCFTLRRFPFRLVTARVRDDRLASPSHTTDGPPATAATA